jgi:hypothetical protein
MTEHELASKSEQAFLVVTLSTATLIVCLGLLALS